MLVLQERVRSQREFNNTHFSVLEKSPEVLILMCLSTLENCAQMPCIGSNKQDSEAPHRQSREDSKQILQGNLYSVY